MDVVRCRCLHDLHGKRYGDLATCPIHGLSDPHPARAYVLTPSDKKLLRSLRVDPDDTEAIQQTRQADEDRWKR